MSQNIEAGARYGQHHAVICRDTLDGRISIEHQTLDGSRICQTELVAIVTPDDVVSHVQRCQKTWGLTNDGVSTSTGKQMQMFACRR